jgi:hypothetical protein
MFDGWIGGLLKPCLGFVEGNVRNVLMGSRKIDSRLARRMVAPGAYRVKVGEKVWRQLRTESFPIEFIGEAGREVLEENETDEDGVTGSPRRGLVTEEAELQGQMRALDFD